MRFSARRAFLLPAALCLALVTASCGSESPTAEEGSGGSAASSSQGDHGDHEDHGSHDHGGSGDEGATPAYQLDGELRAGEFAPLAPRTQEKSRISGKAWVAENGDGTTLTAEVTGLQTGTDYVGHLHAQPCGKDQGGPHFAFDPDGAEESPNEVHFAFTADRSGKGEITVPNPRRVGKGAKSVVVHDAGSENRLVCANLGPADAAAAGDMNSMGDMGGDALVIDVSIEDGSVSPSGQRFEATVGQQVHLHVNSSVADEIHVHSSPEYSFDVKPKDNQMFVFMIDRPGVYEIESHEAGAVIASLAVTP